MKTLRFQNPANQYVATIQSPAIGTLLIGPLYIGLQGAWGPAAGYFLLTFFTAGLFWLVLPFLAAGILRKHFLGMGWMELEAGPMKTKAKAEPVDGDVFFKPVLMAVGVCTVALLGFMAWMAWGI